MLWNDLDNLALPGTLLAGLERRATAINVQTTDHAFVKGQCSYSSGF